jgi:signal transduction histidine kinase
MVREGTHGAAAGVLFRRETPYFLADGSQRMVDLAIAPIKDEAGRVLILAPTGTDITERKQQEEELRRWKDELEVRVQERTQALSESQARLRALSSQLTMAEQRERQKLAENLHDYLAQMLVVGQMKTGLVKRQPELSPATRAMVQDAAKVFQQALTYTRTLIGELSPPSFHDYGLPSALKWLAEQMQKDGLRVDVRTDAEQVPLSEEQAVLIFQCVRELLFNVLKHAAVQQATVQISTDPPGEVQVSVDDRGQGMSEEVSRRAAQPGHLGLFAVRERMESVGGRAEVSSKVGEGTRVTLCLPVAKVRT